MIGRAYMTMPSNQAVSIGRPNPSAAPSSTTRRADASSPASRWAAAKRAAVGGDAGVLFDNFGDERDELAEPSLLKADHHHLGPVEGEGIRLVAGGPDLERRGGELFSQSCIAMKARVGSPHIRRQPYQHRFPQPCSQLSLRTEGGRGEFEVPSANGLDGHIAWRSNTSRSGHPAIRPIPAPRTHLPGLRRPLKGSGAKPRSRG